MKNFLLIMAAVLLISCGQSGPSPDKPVNDAPDLIKPVSPVTPISEVGTIIGEVKFVGTPPVVKKFAVNKDNEACGKEKSGEELEVGPNKGIKNAVISVDNVYGVSVLPKTVVLDQKGCQFNPHVLLVPQGGTVKILNPDGVLHNFHASSSGNPSFNKAQPKFKKEMEVKFDTPGTFKIKCDIHSWMSGWIVVTGHPFFTITDDKGSFRIDGVSTGTRVLKVWHESLGEQNIEVKVGLGQESKVVIEMKLHKP